MSHKDQIKKTPGQPRLRPSQILKSKPLAMSAPRIVQQGNTLLKVGRAPTQSVNLFRDDFTG